MTIDEREQSLYQEFPDLFQPVYRDQRAEVSVGLGWFNLVRELCIELSKMETKPVVMQIKEKFGTLRFYINEYTEELDKIISKYELMSETVCEECGEPGKLRPELRWIKTLCDKHAEERMGKKF